MKAIISINNNSLHNGGTESTLSIFFADACLTDLIIGDHQAINLDRTDYYFEKHKSTINK
jgi:hypothetical protein